VLLVGDEAYYSRVGFKVVPKGRASMPGPVDYGRLLWPNLSMARSPMFPAQSARTGAWRGKRELLP